MISLIIEHRYFLFLMNYTMGKIENDYIMYEMLWSVREDFIRMNNWM